MSPMQQINFEDLKKEKRLLLVSGDSELVQVTTRIYRWYGYIVRGETSSSKALNTMTEFSPQIILLDINIDERSGLELIHDMKRCGRDCNILLFTGNEEPEIIKEAWRAGAFFFLRRVIL